MRSRASRSRCRPRAACRRRSPRRPRRESPRSAAQAAPRARAQLRRRRSPARVGVRSRARPPQPRAAALTPRCRPRWRSPPTPARRASASPVLSNTTVSRPAACSSAIALLNRIPRCAPRPLPTMIAVGVASPSASGQMITTTVIANSSESLTSRPTITAQIRNVAAPAANATSTSQKAARSASRFAGAFELCACWTRPTICASAVSAPTAVARARKVPFLLIVAPISGSSTSLSTEAPRRSRWTRRPGSRLPEDALADQGDHPW